MHKGLQKCLPPQGSKERNENAGKMENRSEPEQFNPFS